jgi:hypothetical protein
MLSKCEYLLSITMLLIAACALFCWASDLNHYKNAVFFYFLTWLLVKV